MFDTLFKANGHWSPGHKPAQWGDPEEAIEQQQFWIVFDACLNHLPANTGRVFMMREFLELDIDAICRELDISTSNCYVILHRARHQLRGCPDRTGCHRFHAGRCRCIGHPATGRQRHCPADRGGKCIGHAGAVSFGHGSRDRHCQRRG
jgi:hypothetical protein